MKQSDFIEEMKVLFANYNKQPVKDVINAWYEMVKDYEYRIFKKAIVKVMEQNKYMPTIKDILDTLKYSPLPMLTDEEKMKQWEKEGIKPSWLGKKIVKEEMNEEELAEMEELLKGFGRT